MKTKSGKRSRPMQARIDQLNAASKTIDPKYGLLIPPKAVEAFLDKWKKTGIMMVYWDDSEDDHQIHWQVLGKKINDRRMANLFLYYLRQYIHLFPKSNSEGYM